MSVDDVPLAPLVLSARAELGFDEIEAQLESSCHTALGREALLADPFPTSRRALDARLAESMEGRSLASLAVVPPFAAVRDLRPLVEHIEKEGVLASLDLIDVARTLDAIGRIRDLVESRGDEWPRLVARARGMHDARDLAKRIASSFDEQGNLRDDASRALAELRGRVRALRADVKVVLDDLIREFDDRGLLRDRVFTLRHDRYVLPVRAEHQSAVEGIVHDASQTGQTVFVEPRAILQIGNRIIFAESAVREEERRILVALTGEVRAHGSAIVDDMEKVGALEATYARGLLAHLIDGRRPTLVDTDDAASLRLDDARHPLLALARGLAERAGTARPPVVANDLSLDGRRALVISGPNAGGKTVALKTVGLVAILARAGLPVPCAPTSKVPLFGAVLAAIGDEQSIAAGLSSFSGHLEGLAEIARHVDAHAKTGALVLLDELCAGTDPNQGAALAQAMLESLVDAGALLVATTHFERLKTLAISDAGKATFRNASFVLDPSSGRPTFALHMDSVGTSNALDAAKRHGLPARVIERAESLLDPTAREVQTLLDELGRKNAELAQKIASLDEERARLAEQAEKQRARAVALQDESDRLRREGARAFQDELKEARKKVALAIETVQKGADARTLNEISHTLRSEEERVARAAAQAEAEVALDPVHVVPGAVVSVRGMPGVRFDVIDVSGDDVVVARGAMRTKKKLADLRVPEAEPRAERGTRGARPQLAAVSGEVRTGDNTIDLRGARVEDALERLEAFFDARMKEGRSRVFVLHGHGTGALKRAIRDALKASRYVDTFRAGEKDEGGDAFTVVELAGA